MSASQPQNTDFFMAQPNDIATARSFADLFALIERSSLSVGGRGFIPERIVILERLFSTDSPSQLDYVQTSHFLTAQLYHLAPEFCRSLAQAEHETVLNVSVLWADSVAWQSTDINPFDLAGFLISLQQLCQAAHQQNAGVYLLISDDGDWAASQ
jgi:hypothetical protein